MVESTTVSKPAKDAVTAVKADSEEAASNGGDKKKKKKNKKGPKKNEDVEPPKEAVPLKEVEVKQDDAAVESPKAAEHKEGG